MLHPGTLRAVILTVPSTLSHGVALFHPVCGCQAVCCFVPFQIYPFLPAVPGFSDLVNVLPGCTAVTVTSLHKAGSIYLCFGVVSPCNFLAPTVG